MQVWGFGCYQVAYLGQKGAMELPEKTKKNDGFWCDYRTAIAPLARVYIKLLIICFL